TQLRVSANYLSEVAKCDAGHSAAEDCLYNNYALLDVEEDPHAQTGTSVWACGCRDKPSICTRQNHRAPWTGRGQRAGAKQPWPERVDCVLQPGGRQVRCSGPDGAKGRHRCKGRFSLTP